MLNQFVHAFVLLLFIVVMQPLAAHQVRPAIVTLTFTQNNQVLAEVETNIEALIVGIGAEHDNTDDAPQVEQYRQLRELPPEQLESRFNLFEKEYQQGLVLKIGGQKVRWKRVSIDIPDTGDTRLSRKSRIYYQADLTKATGEAVWSYASRYGDAIVHFVSQGQQDKVAHWLRKGAESPPYQPYRIQLSPPTLELVWEYGALGFLHILPKGLDHILFVLGLFLLSRKWGALLWQVTAFTLAHSITLALSIFGLIAVSPAIVEPLIALSIVYVGVENLLTRRLHVWRIAVVFVFGLLHGLGFAGVLVDLGLPKTEFVSALVGFNVGVEVGQLAVIGLAFISVFWLRANQGAYRSWIVIPASLVIGIVGLYWFLERLPVSV